MLENIKKTSLNKLIPIGLIDSDNNGINGSAKLTTLKIEEEHEAKFYK